MEFITSNMDILMQPAERAVPGAELTYDDLINLSRIPFSIFNYQYGCFGGGASCG